jgi:SAM-dependent methyltransferase
MTTLESIPALEALKQRHRQTWAAGRYSDIADRYIAEIGQLLVDRVHIQPGSDVLDVCTGAGLAAIPAARAGANVTGLDLVPELLEVARSRAEAEGLHVRWVEGDAERMPLPDSSFDVALSTFGIQFTPNHQASSAEIARVLRPNGMVALVNWMPEGFIGQVFRTLAPYLPPLPEGATPAGRWGAEEHIEGLLAGHGFMLSFDRGYAHFRGPSAEEWVEFMAERYGPLHMARRALNQDRWEALHKDLVDLAVATNIAGAEAFDAPSEYVVAVGRRRTT